MISPVVAIAKKELKVRFGSKSAIFPIIITVVFPLYVFVPTLIEMLTDASPESKYVGFMFFLMVPTIGTTLVGINAFINEIRWNTMQTLLLSPISKNDIFLGKSLSSIGMGLLIEMFLVIILLFFVSPLKPSLYLLFFLVGPLAIVFITFSFILGIAKFPVLSESGGSMIFPIILET